MHRGSDKHGARQDDKLKHDVEGLVRSNRPSRIEEGRDPEPPADDDPEIGFERRLDTGEAGAAGSGEGSERSAGDESGGSAGSAEERTPRREGG